MRSEKSSNGAARALIGENFKRYWAVPLLTSISMFIIVAMPQLMMADASADEKLELLNNIAHNGSVLIFTLLFAIGTSAGLLFEYIEKKNSADYMHSLPVTRGKLFSSTLIAGTIFVAIPIALGALMLALLMPSGSALTVLGWAAVSLITALCVMSITVVACFVSGNILMTLFNIGFLNLIGLMAVGLVDGYMITFVDGYVRPEIMKTLYGYASPLVAMYGGPELIPCAVFICVTIALLFISYLLYKARPIERSGDSLVFKWTKAGMMIVVTFLGTALFALLVEDVTGFDTPAVWAEVALGFFIIFTIMSILIYRTTKIFNVKNIITGVVTIALVFGFITMFRTDVMGYETRSPEASQVKAVSIEGCVPVDSHRYDGKYFKGSDKGNIYLEDQENIDAVCDLQSAFASYLKKNDLSDEYDGTADIVMKMKDGSEFRRSYTWGDNEEPIDDAVSESALVIYSSEEFKEKFSFNNMKKYQRIMIDAPGVEMFAADDKNGDEYEESESVDVPRDKAAGLVEAMEKDFLERTYTQALRESEMSSSSCMIEICFVINDEEEWVSFYVLPSDRYTKAWIKENIQ